MRFGLLYLELPSGLPFPVYELETIEETEYETRIVQGEQKPSSIYRHLRRNQIRLFVMEPASNGTTEIRGRLIPADMYHPMPRYEALSYAWGSPEKTKSIMCNSKEIRISGNLHAALSRPQKDESKRILWIDAICIDQDDIVEQGLQVRMMQDILFVAYQVLLWVEEETNEVSGVFGILE